MVLAVRLPEIPFPQEPRVDRMLIGLFESWLLQNASQTFILKDAMALADWRPVLKTDRV